MYSHQFGFEKGKPIDHAILDLYVNMIKFVEKHEKTRAIFVDFAKAIDTLNHDILLRKLEHYGIREEPLERLKSYLEHRKQCVKKQSMPIAVI